MRISSKRVFNLLLSAISLGILINFCVNWIFNFRNPINTFHVEEYIIAIIISFFLLGGAKVVNNWLAAKHLKNHHGLSQLAWLFLIDFSIIFFVINFLGSAYMLILYGDTYSYEEYIVINMVTMSFTSIFIISDLYIQKRRREHLEEKNLDPIAVNYKKGLKWVDQSDIEMCYVKNGVTFIVAGQKHYICDQSLGELESLLQGDKFIRANRQFILTKKVIENTKSSEYGKIIIDLKDEESFPEQIIVSRKQAAKFRSWLSNSTSPINL